MTPVGPHPTPMFEINVLTPAQFGAFFPWIVVNHGPLSVLVHPQTGDGMKEHTELATWLGKKLELNLGIFDAMTKAFSKLTPLKQQQEDK
ncbi:MAG: hypothetical protein Q9195_000891 [Heterodermia aff. obscurata]